jgi:beta-glucosidase
MKVCKAICVFLVLLCGIASADYRDADAPLEDRVEDLLQRLTLEEKVSLCAGGEYMDTTAIDRLGVPSLKMADGPHGVRHDRATCFPTGVSIGSTWAPELIRLMGIALARETRARGRNMLLGPCVNIQRLPVGGRNFESFSEDPYLAARLAVAYVKGVQSQRVATSTKHYAANNQEWERTTISAEVGERALREIYLPAFKAAVQEADTWSIMAAYNKVNGHYCCANQHLLTGILKEEWGFRGFVVSDWSATHSTVKSAMAGLDLEMPGPGEYFSDALLEAVRNGEVPETVIDDKARRILRVVFLAGLFDGDPAQKEAQLDTPQHRKLARMVASDGIVLLKNEGGALPLDGETMSKVAVLGPNAAEARLGGGGSSSVTPFYQVSVLDGIKQQSGGIAIGYAVGATLPGEVAALPGKYLHPHGAPASLTGLRGTYFDNPDLAGKPVLVRTDAAIDFDWQDGAPAAGLPEDSFSVRWEGRFIPPRTGVYSLGLLSDDGSRLFINNEMVVDHWSAHGPSTRTHTMRMEGGQPYDVRLEYFEEAGGARVTLGWTPPEDHLREAVSLARAADAAVVCIGLSWTIEGEGVDRQNMELPGAQAELIKAVAAVNDRTVVVFIGGTPIPMEDWIDDVEAVLFAGYPGQEGGHAVADVLFGKVNPSGKLPMTFPRALEDVPAMKTYPGSAGRARFEDGVYVGYRYFDTYHVEPMFPFGHGLSYTSFEYENLEISPVRAGSGSAVKVGFDIINTGERVGQEVAQLYVHDRASRLGRPTKELKGFRKVRLAPGERRRVEFELGEEAWSYFDPLAGGWIVEPGTFDLFIGSSSRDLRLEGVFERVE